MKKTIVFLISLLFFTTVLDAGIDLTDEEYDEVVDRFSKDKQIIHENNIRWNKLKKSKPKIKYDIVDGEVIIQSIEIPIHKSKPLVYEVQFKIEKNNAKEFVPLTLQICAMLESEVGSDGKLGIQVFSLSPLIKHKVGFNALIGLRSSGISVSYSFPKPFSNTSVHIFSGFSYSLSNTFGIGVSANL